MMMTTRTTALIFQSAINACLDFTGTLKRDVFNGMSQSSTTSVTNGPFTFHHNYRLSIE